jgi:hypothetical protein
VTLSSASATHGGISSNISFATVPGAVLTIRVHYNTTNADATSQSLKVPQTAGGDGSVYWNWTCDTTKSQPATAYIHATWNGQSQDYSFNFNVG